MFNWPLVSTISLAGTGRGMMSAILGLFYTELDILASFIQAGDPA